MEVGGWSPDRKAFYHGSDIHENKSITICAIEEENGHFGFIDSKTLVVEFPVRDSSGNQLFEGDLIALPGQRLFYIFDYARAVGQPKEYGKVIACIPKENNGTYDNFIVIYPQELSTCALIKRSTESIKILFDLMGISV